MNPKNPDLDLFWWIHSSLRPSRNGEEALGDDPKSGRKED